MSSGVVARRGASLGLFPKYVYEYVVDGDVRCSTGTIGGMVKELCRMRGHQVPDVDNLMYAGLNVHVELCGRDYNAYTEYDFHPLGSSSYYSSNIVALMRVNPDGSRDYGRMLSLNKWLTKWVLMYSADYDAMLNEYATYTVNDWQTYTGLLAFLSLYIDAHANDADGKKSLLLPMPVFIEELQEIGFDGMRNFLEVLDNHYEQNHMHDVLNRTVSRCTYTMPTMQTMTLDRYNVPTTDENKIENYSQYWSFPILDDVNQELQSLDKRPIMFI